jgi:hypothetical protein
MDEMAGSAVVLGLVVRARTDNTREAKKECGI